MGTLNFRQPVDQWFVRSKQTVQYRSLKRDPNMPAFYQCTYIIAGVDEVTGEWEDNKADAQESAAEETMETLAFWSSPKCVNPLHSAILQIT
jgi:hypothetical protein